VGDDERAHDRGEDLERLRQREPPLVLEMDAQVDALEQFLDDVEGAVVLPSEVVDDDAVGVLDVRGRPRLSAGNVG
jgi:hypothetical protein